jgi:hypothetical protein
VLLDPSEKEAAASASVSATRKPVTVHAKFLLIAIGVAAGIAIPAVMQPQESPHKPGKKPRP